MSTYTAQRTFSKTDRISRAARIIETGKVQPQANGLFRVLSDRPNTAYTVTADRCGCPDFEHLNGSEPCKHQWAAIGAVAAILICAIRQAESIAALETLGKAYAEAMQQQPAAFAPPPAKSTSAATDN